MGLFDRAQEEFKEQSPDEQKLARFVRDKVEESRSRANRVAHEGIWMTNIAYLLGYDNLTYNTASRSFQPVNNVGQSLRKGRIHINKILPTVQNRQARLCKNPPKYDVMPESNSQEDKDGARLGLQVLNAMWEKLRINEKRMQLIMWTQECGHAYLKVCWDDALGKLMEKPPEDVGGLMAENPDPNAEQKPQYMFEGDVRVDVVSSFEIFPDPMANCWDDVKNSYLTQCKIRKLDYFRTRYPEKGMLVKEEQPWLLSTQYLQRINTMNTRGPSGMNDAVKDSAIEMIRYEARSEKYPKGRMICVANGILLEDKELPVGEIPFAKFDDIMVGGKYYSESIVTHLRPIQDQFNENIRRTSSWTNKMLAGKYQAPRGSGLTQESLDDQSGEVVYYDVVPNAPAGIQAIQIPQIPQWAYNERESLSKEFFDISGLSEVSRGTIPAAGIPAIGMQLLTEQDDTRIGVITEQHEHAFADVGHLILEYVQAYYTDKRKLKVSGKNQSYETLEFSGEDLVGNTDVMVIRGSTLPGSKVLRRQEIMNAYSQGLLGDPNDSKVREKVLNMLEFGDVAEMWKDKAIDEEQYNKGIKMLEAGEEIPVHELDNHAYWIQELNRYRKSDKYANMDPSQKAMLEAAIEQHVNFMLKLSGHEVGPPPPAPPPPPTEMDMGASAATDIKQEPVQADAGGM